MTRSHTESRINEFGQPIGLAVADWRGATPPSGTQLTGKYCKLVPTDPELHADPLHAQFSPAGAPLWTYVPCGPFASSDSYRVWLEEAIAGGDKIFLTILDLQGQSLGVATYMRIQPGAGVIEVGSIMYSPALQRSRAGTEAMYLMMRQAFEQWGYRRYEWKCDALNAKSCAAAKRYGFRFEGIFRQALVYKGRNRDTAWYSVTDKEWPALKSAFERWLEPSNFDAGGQQRQSLASLRSAE